MFTEDLSQFTKDFGVTAVFVRGMVEILTATVILDAPPKELSEYDRSFYDEKFYGAKIIGADTTLYGVESELRILQLNDVCTVAGSSYKVQVITPDGTGFMFVGLSVHRT